MYKCDFFNWTGVRRGESPNQILELLIEGDRRTEILQNILTQNWEENGELYIDDAESIIFDIKQMLLLSKYSEEEGSYLIDLYTRLNIDLRPIFTESYKDINDEEILDMFCNCIKESLEINNLNLIDGDGLNIEYDISKV